MSGECEKCGEQDLDCGCKRPEIKWPLFCFHKNYDQFWFRIFGYGISFEKTRLNFSERNGYKKILKLPFGWR